MKLGQGHEEHVYKMRTVYLMLTDMHDKYDSDKCEIQTPPSSHSTIKNYTTYMWPFLDGKTKEWIRNNCNNNNNGSYHLLRAHHRAKLLLCMFSLKLGIWRWPVHGCHNHMWGTGICRLYSSIAPVFILIGSWEILTHIYILDDWIIMNTSPSLSWSLSLWFRRPGLLLKLGAMKH